MLRNSFWRSGTSRYATYHHYGEVIDSYSKEDADAEVKLMDEAKSYGKTKTIPTNFNEKKATCKTQNFYILLAFLSIPIALLIGVTFTVISQHK